MTGERIHCCIDGCRRSSRRQHRDEEIMCRKHWRMVDPVLRERHKRVFKRWRRVERVMMRKAVLVKSAHTGRTLDALVNLFMRAAHRTWEACKMDATIKSAMHVEDARPRHVA